MESKKKFRNEWIRFLAYQNNISVYDLFDDDIDSITIKFTSDKCREYRYFNNMIYPYKSNNQIKINITKPSTKSREIIMKIDFLDPQEEQQI